MRVGLEFWCFVEGGEDEEVIGEEREGCFEGLGWMAERKGCEEAVSATWLSGGQYLRGVEEERLTCSGERSSSELSEIGDCCLYSKERFCKRYEMLG